MIPRRAFLLALAATLLLSGCGQAVPAERAAYLGDWRSDGGRWNGQGDGMSLRIAPDGRIDYRRQQGRSHTKISAPIQRFVGDDFEVGVLFWTTTFKVQQAPRQEGSRWTMTVDGVRLERAVGANAI